MQINITISRFHTFILASRCLFSSLLLSPCKWAIFLSSCCSWKSYTGKWKGCSQNNQKIVNIYSSSLLHINYRCSTSYRNQSVNWFALQINWLVSIRWGTLVVNELTARKIILKPPTWLYTISCCFSDSWSSLYNLLLRLRLAALAPCISAFVFDSICRIWYNSCVFLNYKMKRDTPTWKYAQKNLINRNYQ